MDEDCVKCYFCWMKASSNGEYSFNLNIIWNRELGIIHKIGKTFGSLDLIQSLDFSSHS